MNPVGTGFRVLVGVDGSDGALAAVRWAVRHVAGTGAPLELLHVASEPESVSLLLPVPVGISTGGLHRPRLSAEEILQQAAQTARSVADVEITTRTVSGDVVSALRRGSSDAGLLVLGCRDRSRVTATLFGSVADRVAADAACPVVVVRGEAEPSGPIVVAVDGSGTDEQALRFAFAEAARQNCVLVAVHAWQPPMVPTGVGTPAVSTAATQFVGEELPAAAQRLLSRTVQPWRAAFPDLTVHERLLQGHPETVVAAQTDGAALCVVGSRGRAPLTGLLFGSTSQVLLHRAGCPIAVVRNLDEPSG